MQNNCAAAILPSAIADGNPVYVAFAVYLTQLTGTEMVCGFGGEPTYASNQQCAVFITPTGALEAVRGNRAAVLATTGPSLVKPGVWNHFQFKFIVSDTVGEIECYHNGDLVLDVSASDTRARSETSCQYVWMCTDGDATIDDLVISDSAYPGDVRVVCLLPQTDAVAAGSNAQFTCSTGSDHGALVDEQTPNDDTDYVYSSTLNHIDTWEYPALGYTGTILGVQMTLRGKKSDTGTRAIAAVTRPASTDRVHATNHYLPSDAYSYYRALWELNPEDSAAWEVADVDGAEFGVKVTV